jgi:hypothetical protein
MSKLKFAVLLALGAALLIALEWMYRHQLFTLLNSN